MRRIVIGCVLIASSLPSALVRAQPATPPGTDPPKTPAPAPTPDPGAPNPATLPATPAPPLQAPDTQGTASLPAPHPAPPPARDDRETRHERALAEERCAKHDADCDWLATLSKIERESVVRALASRGYMVDQAPWGKTIGKIQVFNDEVFAESEGGFNKFLQFFNIFHYTTTENTIRSDSVVQPGELWDPARVAETARHLRDPLFSSVVAVIPVESQTPGQVDALIVTRDIWSLRLNTTYTFQQGKLTNLAASLSENDFLGRRAEVAIAVVMDQGSIAIGPQFIDKNLFGEHINLQASVAEIVNRDDLLSHHDFNSEGSQSTIALSRPLWSLASEWAAGVTFTHRWAINRQFRGTSLDTFTYTDPTTGATTPFGREYEMHQWDVNAAVTRQWGTDIKSQFSVGYIVDSTRPRPLDSFDGDDAEREAFIADVLPRSELTSEPYVEYSLFTPTYRTLRNISTFDLAEDLRLGPSLDVSLGQALKVFDSDNNFQRLASSFGWTFPWTRDGFFTLSGGLGGRLQSGNLIDATASGSVRVATPVFVDWLRAQIQSSIATRWHDTQNQFYALGSDTGLRGFAINQFTGQRFFNAQFELRSLPYPFWVLRFGGVAFFDLGDAADTFSQFYIHKDAGLGLRILIPQISAQLLRFDFAFPLDGINRGAVQFSAGFGSEF